MVLRSRGQLKLQTMTHWNLEMIVSMKLLFIYMITKLHRACFFPQKNKLRKLLQSIS